MNNSHIILMTSIFTASALGSWHCVFMCGPLTTSLTSSNLKRNHFISARLLGYHFGRMLSYVAGGALFGHLGLSIADSHGTFGKALGAVLFLILSVGLWIHLQKAIFPNFRSAVKIPIENLGWDKTVRKIWTWLYRKPLASVLLGFSSVLLPCGWLYTFFAASAVTASPTAGALTMFLFWLGSMPALMILPGYLQNFKGKISPRQHSILMSLVFASAMYSWGSFYLFTA